MYGEAGDAFSFSHDPIVRTARLQGDLQEVRMKGVILSAYLVSQR